MVNTKQKHGKKLTKYLKKNNTKHYPNKFRCSYLDCNHEKNIHINVETFTFLHVIIKRKEGKTKQVVCFTRFRAKP